MKAVVGTQANMVSLGGRVDTAHGYPKDGTNIGGGRHVSRAQGRTLRWAIPFKHPSLNQWAYEVDRMDTSGLSAADRTLVQNAQTLTPDWFGQ